MCLLVLGHCLQIESSSHRSVLALLFPQTPPALGLLSRQVQCIVCLASGFLSLTDTSASALGNPRPQHRTRVLCGRGTSPTRTAPNTAFQRQRRKGRRLATTALGHILPAVTICSDPDTAVICFPPRLILTCSSQVPIVTGSESSC